MARIPTLAGLLMAILALPSVPWLFLDVPPVAERMTGESAGWITWLAGHVAVVVGFGTAAYLAYRRHRRWPVAVLLICGYVAVISTPPLVLMSLDAGFSKLAGSIWGHAVMTGGPRAFYLIWNLVVLPILPALIVPFAAWSSWQTYRGREWNGI